MKQKKIINLQSKLRNKFLKKGVKMIAPETVFLTQNTKIGKNVTIDPYVVISENVSIGNNVRILSFSHLEGTGIPPIEAAMSGNVVIGYTGGGGSTYWKKPIFNKVENGEIRDYGEKIIKTIKSYNRNWVKHTSRQRKKLSETYSEENEIKSLKKFMKQALKFF